MLWAIFATLCVVFLALGTYTGNSDIYDKIGQEMKTLSKATLAVLTSWRWIVEGWLRLQARNLASSNEYVGFHRPEVVASRPQMVWAHA
jgi:hypothetical protein